MIVTDLIEDHQARCLRHVLSLRMLARDAMEAPLSLLAVAQVTRATEAILAEAEAAAREARTAAGSGPGLGVFLGARLSRLAVAADDAVAAARAGDLAQLRRHLRRFDTLTSAIWAVQDAVSRSAGPVAQT